MKTDQPLSLDPKRVEQSKPSEMKEGEKKAKKSWLGRKISLRKKGIRAGAEEGCCGECCGITMIGFGMLMCMTIVLIPCGFPLVWFGGKKLMKEDSSW